MEKVNFLSSFYFLKTDATRRAASTMARHSAAQASYKSAARKSIDISNEEGGFQRLGDTNGTCSKTAGVRLKVNDKPVENEEDGTHSEIFLLEDGSANSKSLDTSFPQVSAQGEEEENKKTDSEYTTLDDESFDSAL